MKCPVCDNEMNEGIAKCGVCGYKIPGSTEEFSTVGVEPMSDTGEIKPHKDPVLTGRNGRQKGTMYRLDGDVHNIGRSPKSEIFLNDMTVSRHHATIEKTGNGFSIKDENSFNGVWINNENITHAMLKDGDLIQIGSFILKYSE